MRFVYKIHSTRFKKANWELELSIEEARKNDEIVSLSDSTILRFINEMNGIFNADSKEHSIRKDIKKLKRLPISSDTRRQIKELYSKLYGIQSKPDYLCLVIDDDQDYYYAYKNKIELNGKVYKRLVGTNGGVKKETIIFTTEEKYDELNRRMENGRNKDKPLVPAKYEAYRALTCSGSTPVSDPIGDVIVVNDCFTKFKSNIIMINDEGKGDPLLDYIENYDIELNASDGYGLIIPDQSMEWTSDLGEQGISSGFCIRNSFCKGMLFTFDFIEFANTVAKSNTIMDAWGQERDITKASIILTTSMLKLWDNYDSMEDYHENCKENGYCFSISKILPFELESERQLNYQFIQSYDLSDQEIDELIQPTVQEIKDVLGLDWQKALLFLNGKALTEDTIKNLPYGIGKAIMACPDIINDSYVKSFIYKMIKKKINDAKIGVLNIHANYSIISGDCYALCQSMFGLPITGLLKAEEVYNRYWADNALETKNEKVVCFRAPMTSHNNIRLLNISKSSDAVYWFRHMPTVTVLNCWDTTSYALNGCDFDGDAVFLTDNKILLDNTKSLPAIVCIQRKAEKLVITEDLLFKSNIDSFGSEIGPTTNRITSMFDIQSRFKNGSEEWNILDYRIKCGQLYQQNAIDKAKGIIAKPMPKHWYSKPRGENRSSIVADKKPYFMKYIYPETMKRYSKYVENSNRKCLMEFRITLEELINKKYKTKLEKQFLKYYYDRMPVSIENGLMNRICRKIENEFRHPIKILQSDLFSYEIYKSGYPYNDQYKKELSNLYLQYNKSLQSLAKECKEEHLNQDEISSRILLQKQLFKDKCDEICPDKFQLCDILLDICYSRSSTKQFVWDMCADTIIFNLLRKNGATYQYPEKCDSGDVQYAGSRFEIKTLDAKNELKENVEWYLY